MQGKLSYGIGGLIIGLVAGFFAANSLNRQAVVSPSSTTADQTNPLNPTGSAQPGGTQEDVALTLDKAANEPENFVAQMRAGDMYAQIGRFDKAIEYYQKGVALDGNSAAANVVLANAYFDSRSFEDAEKFYTRALELEPNNINARTDLGATFVERPMPDYDRGISEFRKVLEADPANGPALYYLGIASLRKGLRPDAEKALAELEKTGKQPELADRLRQNLTAGIPATR